jgi:hypothetical protein
MLRKLRTKNRLAALMGMTIIARIAVKGASPARALTKSMVVITCITDLLKSGAYG